MPHFLVTLHSALLCDMKLSKAHINPTTGVAGSNNDTTAKLIEIHGRRKAVTFALNPLF